MAYVPTVDISMLVRRSGGRGLGGLRRSREDPPVLARGVDGASRRGSNGALDLQGKGSETDVEVVESVPGELLLLRWDQGQLLRIEFGDRQDATVVRVFLDGFSGDDAAGQAIDAMSGFALVLASLKMWLEHGIEGELMYDRFPDCEYSDR